MFLPLSRAFWSWNESGADVVSDDIARFYLLKLDPAALRTALWLASMDKDVFDYLTYRCETNFRDDTLAALPALLQECKADEHAASH